MATFRKRPIAVEATQWFPGIEHLGVVGADPDKLCGCVVFNGDKAGKPHLHTIHGGSYVALESGDWVIAEPDGQHFYPCKRDLFEATYEAV